MEKAMLSIRAGTQEDQVEVQRLLTELGEATGNTAKPFSEHTFNELIAGSRGRLIVAEEDGRLLGLAAVSYNLALRYDGEYCQLEELVVSPAARGKNLGARLVEQTLEDAAERGCAEYGLYLISSTEHNRPFYEKFGLEGVGTEMRKRLLDAGES